MLIASMAASIIFLSAGTRRVFPAEIFLNRDVAPVSAICMVSSTSSICSSFSWHIACSLPAGGSCLANGPGRDRFAAIATGNSIIDGTSGLVQVEGRQLPLPVLVSCSEMVLSSLPYVLIWHLPPLVLSSLRTVVTWYLPPLVPDGCGLLR